MGYERKMKMKMQNEKAKEGVRDSTKIFGSVEAER